MMFRKLVVAMVLAFGVSTVYAQNRKNDLDGKSPEEIADMKTKRMSEKLSLSDAQAESVHQIVLTSEQEKMVIRAKYPQMDEAKREGDALRKETQTKVQEVLTPEQMQKMKESRHSAEAKRERGPMESPDWDKKIKEIQTTANLSDDQVNQLKLIFEDSDKKRQEIIKKYPELREAKKELGENRKETDKEIKSVLTSEQIQKWDEQKQHPRRGSRSHGQLKQ